MRVIVAGRLMAADLRRLEHACSSALTARFTSLELDLRCVTQTDDAAGALIARLVARGAVVMGRPTARTD